MRLGQLSRKLGISTSQIINFLATKEVTIEDTSNAKIDDLHARWVTEKYAPHLLIAVEDTISEEHLPASRKESEVAPTIEEVEEMQKAVAPAKSDDPVESSSEAAIELIKAPKIELAGLKVLGKIELPEKKKLVNDETTSDQKPQTREGKRTERQKSNRPSFERPEKNPIALQREREEREAERKRKERLAREKEKKTYNYLSRVKAQAPPKKSKYLKESIEEQIVVPEKIPTSFWGKFLRWLRT